MIKELHRVDATLRSALVNLELVSHAPTQNLAPIPRDTSESPGGARPGGTDRDRPARNASDDERRAWEASYHRKTPSWFGNERRKVWDRHNRDGDDQRAIAGLESLLKQANECVLSWRKQPAMIGVLEEVIEPISFLWKCMVADDDSGSIKQREDRYGIDRATIHRYRLKYRGLQRKRAA
jgi:hypothetical protein